MSKLEIVKESIHQAELRLQGQASLAIAADARASSLGAALIGATTAMLAGAFSIFAIDVNNWFSVPIFITAICFFVGAFFCLRAVRPVGFFTGGNSPENWKEDIENNKPYEDCMKEVSEYYTYNINANKKVLKDNAKLYEYGSYFAFAAPMVGAFSALITFACVYCTCA